MPQTTKRHLAELHEYQLKEYYNKLCITDTTLKTVFFLFEDNICENLKL